MEARIQPGRLKGSLPAIASKSDAHRILIASAFADQPTRLCFKGGSADIDATAASLNALGADVSRQPWGLLVKPIQTPADAPVLPCGESASTMRFLLPVAPVLCHASRFAAQGRLPQRPMSPLRERMQEHGVEFTQREDGVALDGRLSGGIYELPGDVSSQFITGLLFALPLLPEGGEIRLTTPLQSAGYVEMTLETLARFGIRVERQENSFLIPGGQRFRSPGEVTVEGDWSNAAFFLAAGAMGGDVTVTGLNLKSLQCDRVIVEILREMGVNITERENGVRAAATPLHGVRIDAGNCPDLVPIVAVVAAFARGETEIYNAQRLRIKESDRLRAMAYNLGLMGAAVQERPDGLLIRGCDHPAENRFSSFDDHRVAMAMSIAGLAMGGTVTGAEAVNKSYPRFYEDYQSLGGNVHVF